MVSALIRKLEGFAPVGMDDRKWLEAATIKPQRLAPSTDIISEGDRPEEVILILDGFACRYKTTPEGHRQIFAYLVPGDFCDLHVALLGEMDHSISTLSTCNIVRFPRKAVLDLTEHRPALTRAFWWCSLVDEATLREWLVNVGARKAEQRIAHLFCELHVRLTAVGLTTNGSFVLPISQGELGDTVGISPVHVNRSLKALREAGLVVFRDEIVQIPSIERLKDYASFTPNYLHIGGRRPL